MRLKRQKHEAQVRAMEKAAEDKIKAVEERLGVLEEEHGPAPGFWSKYYRFFENYDS